MSCSSSIHLYSSIYVCIYNGLSQVTMLKHATARVAIHVDEARHVQSCVHFSQFRIMAAVGQLRLANHHEMPPPIPLCLSQVQPGHHCHWLSGAYSLTPHFCGEPDCATVKTQARHSCQPLNNPSSKQFQFPIIYRSAVGHRAG